MFISDSYLWKALSNFARSLKVPKDLIDMAKEDFNEILDQYTETRRFVSKECSPTELDRSLSMQNFYPWLANFLCFYELILSGFRHTALRELRYYLEASARSYYIDSKHHAKTYEDKVAILKEVRKIRGFKKLLSGLSKEKQYDIADFYNELCDYVHLSEQAQTDALGDFVLNLALKHPEYERDYHLLQKTFGHSRYLLLVSLHAL